MLELAFFAYSESPGGVACGESACSSTGVLVF